jgi:hypothetical protein
MIRDDAIHVILQVCVRTSSIKWLSRIESENDLNKFHVWMSEREYNVVYFNDWRYFNTIWKNNVQMMTWFSVHSSRFLP